MVIFAFVGKWVVALLGGAVYQVCDFGMFLDDLFCACFHPLLCCHVFAYCGICVRPSTLHRSIYFLSGRDRLSEVLQYCSCFGRVRCFCCPSIDLEPSYDMLCRSAIIGASWFGRVPRPEHSGQGSPAGGEGGRWPLQAALQGGCSDTARNVRNAMGTGLAGPAVLLPLPCLLQHASLS